MKNKFYIIVIVLTVSLLSGCQSLWYMFLDTVVDIAPDRFSFEEKNIEVSIPVFSSQIPTRNMYRISPMMFKVIQ